MKKIACIALLTIVSIVASAQKEIKIIHLKNGANLSASKVDSIDSNSIKVYTTDGNIFKYDRKDIVSIEEMGMNDFGGNLGIGIAVGGGGIVGVPVIYSLSNNLKIEVGLFYRPVVDLTNGSSYQTIMLAGGPNYFFGSKYISAKNKIKRNGIGLKAGHSFGSYSQSFVSANWVLENFKQKSPNKSFIFELGLGVIASKSDLYSEDLGPLIYWKCHWCFYNKK
ncbi:MAG: hypothetical protein PF541_14050 [Prolixibacteraceae bacterium]|jgi:hypothetical protein|nr:hypothetical protein [Prolixibacteraceae bacterium]